MKRIVFDMDGTIYGLYQVDGWLDMLRNEDATAYLVGKALLNLSALARQIHRVQAIGYRVEIVTWLAMDSSPEFDVSTSNAKLAWLNKHLPSVEFDAIHMCGYGTPKSQFKTENDILFDDNAEVRADWGDGAYDVDNILEILRGLQ